jgi:hypothetical protein
LKIEKPSLESKFFSRQNSFFQKTEEKFGGKKITLQMNEVLLKLRLSK